MIPNKARRGVQSADEIVIGCLGTLLPGFADGVAEVADDFGGEGRC